ncbi:response regulator [bacterium]|nr:response regulator [bacterium]
MKTLLIVDDAKLMRMMIRKSISEESFNIIEAANGKEALALYKEHSPDVVTMDITMKIMNGFEATKHILAYNNEAKIIIITALGQEVLLQKCIKEGISDFLLKPFSKERLVKVIEKHMNEKN